MKIEIKTLGFFLEVTCFILAGYFIGQRNLLFSIYFLVIGGVMAYVVGKALIKEGVNSCTTISKDI